MDIIFGDMDDEEFAEGIEELKTLMTAPDPKEEASCDIQTVLRSVPARISFVEEMGKLWGMEQGPVVVEKTGWGMVNDLECGDDDGQGAPPRQARLGAVDNQLVQAVH